MPIVPGSDAAALQRAAHLLAAGELVAFPTETVYGLGARADDDAAVARVFSAKGRPAEHPLIVHIGSVDAAAVFAAEINADARRLMRAFWPGPLTLIVPRQPGMAEAAAGGQDSIGLRMPAHPLALALLQAAAALGVEGVAAPSANRFGQLSPTTAAHVQQAFGSRLMVLDGGACDVGIESAIVDCTRAQPALLRPGQLAAGVIAAALGRSLATADAASPRASGTLASHYAPRAPVHLFDGPHPPATHMTAAAEGAGIVGVYSSALSSSWPRVLHKVMPDDAAAVAHELFAVLHAFDAAGVAAIWVQRPPAGAEWNGVRDRLQRAAA